MVRGSMIVETVAILFALFVIAALQGYNASRIARIEAGYDVLKKILDEKERYGK